MSLIRSFQVFIAVVLCFYINAQEQMSNFQNFEVDVPGYYKEYAVFDGIEYLLEKDKLRTKVSRVFDDKITFLHYLNERPVNVGNYSKMYVFDSLVIELYSQSIYFTNFVSGEFVKIIDLGKEGVSKVSDNSILFAQNELLFKGKQNGNTFLFHVDLVNGAVTKSKEFDRKWKIYSTSKVYFTDDMMENVYLYDILTGQEVLLLNIPDGIQRVVNRGGIENKEFFIVTNSNGIYNVRSENDIDYSDCFESVSGTILNVAFRKDIVFIGLKNESLVSIFGKNRFTCEVEYDHKVYDIFTNSSTRFFSKKMLGEDYLLFSYYAGSATEGRGKQGLIDLNEKSITDYSFRAAYLVEESNVLIDSVLYVIGKGEVELGDYFSDCYSIDLRTKEVGSLNRPFGVFARHVEIGKGGIDNHLSIYIYTRLDDKYYFSYKLNEKELVDVEYVDLYRNSGYDQIGKPKVNNDKFYFFHDDHISYVSEKGDSTMLEVIESTPFIQKDEFLYCLIKNDLGVFRLKINTLTEKLDTHLISNIRFINSNSLVSETKIISLNHSGAGYYDIGTDKYTVLRDEIGINSYGSNFVSGSKILSIEDNEFVIHDMDTKVNIKSPYKLNYSTRVYPDHEGGFIICEYEPWNGTYRKTHFLTQEGNLIDIGFSDFIRPYYNVSKYANGLLVIPFYRDGGHKILLKDEVETKTFFFDPIVSKNQDLNIVTKHGVVVLETVSDDIRKTFIFGMNRNFVSVHPQGYEGRLLHAIIEGSHVALFYENVEGKLKIDIFDLITDNIIRSNEFDYLDNRYNFGYLGELRDNHYLLTYDTPELGNEPYVFSMLNGKVDLVSDMVEGKSGSDPSSFVLLNDYGYFTAISPDGSRQWFRIDILSDTKTIEKVSNYHTLIVSPNPSENKIRFDKHMNSVNILDVNGRSVYTQGGFGIKEIDITNLKPQLYFIHSIDGEGRSYIGKFIKGGI